MTAGDDGVALVLAGELDLASKAEVDPFLRSHAFLDGRQRLLIDLRNVDFIDSSGLRLLLGIRNDAMRNGRHLTLMTPAAPEARKIFMMTGTRGLFDWADG